MFEYEDMGGRHQGNSTVRSITYENAGCRGHLLSPRPGSQAGAEFTSLPVNGGVRVQDIVRVVDHFVTERHCLNL